MKITKETLDKLLGTLNITTWNKRVLDKLIKGFDTDIKNTQEDLTNLSEDVDDFKDDVNTKLANKADLTNGKVPASQLPSYVDDVVEVEHIADVTNPEKDKIYIDLSDGHEYRWSGSQWVDIHEDVYKLYESLQQAVDELKKGGAVTDKTVEDIQKKIDTIETRLDDLEENSSNIDNFFKEADKKYYSLTDGQDLEHLVDTINEGLGHVEKDLENDYCRKDGTYPDLTAGTAQNLEGKVDIVNSSMYRTVAGEDSVVNGFEAASINSIQGNAVAWNQLLINGDFADDSYWRPANRVSIEISDNQIKIIKLENANAYADYSRNFLPNFIDNHKLYFGLDAKADSPISSAAIAFLDNGSDQQIRIVGDLTTNWRHFSGVTAQSDIGDKRLYLYSVSVENAIYVKNVQIFDLTLIYGAGNEPTTPEQFEADYQRWFGKTLTYEEYDEGSIRPVLATGIKTVGFNLYSGGDLEFVKGYESNTKIFVDDYVIWENNVNYKGTICLKSKITATNTTDNPGFRFLYSDGTEVAVSYREDFATISSKNKIVKSILTYTSHITGSFTYSDICVNFSWSGNRDGEYEPYWEETKPLPLTTLTGKLNGEGESVVVFPDGMKRAGDVYDEIKVENGVTKAIKRVGSVDLGNAHFDVPMDYKDVPGVNYNISNSAITTVEKLYKFAFLNAKYTNGTLSTHNCIAHYGANSVWRINDDNFEGLSPTEVNQLLNGVLLYYELAEPKEYIVDNFELPLVYKVDDFGTEQVLSPEKGVAPILITRYGINAVDAIRNMSTRYISTQSDDNFLQKLNAVTGVTWIREWDNITNSYIYKIIGNIPNCNPIYSTSGNTLIDNSVLDLSPANGSVSVAVNIETNGAVATLIVPANVQVSFSRHSSKTYDLKFAEGVAELAGEITGKLIYTLMKIGNIVVINGALYE